MSEKERPIWEQYGIGIAEYARAFNKELSNAAERLGITMVEKCKGGRRGGKKGGKRK
ncbi:MAG: hypothetical protein MUO31_06745 [Thermodesulfovibrionales bacterium]|nr:hypothetical protein [Thermodesulfovibrionales bacterium]